jgi:hypothetical protein
MYDARRRVVLDGYRLANSSRFSRWMAENPKKKETIKLILGGGRRPDCSARRWETNRSLFPALE